jgi:hypothetical protein
MAEKCIILVPFTPIPEINPGKKAHTFHHSKLSVLTTMEKTAKRTNIN